MTVKTLPTKAPNLPSGPVQYDQRYQDQLGNVLRLYFNQIDNNTGSLNQTANSISVMNWLDGGCY